MSHKMPAGTYYIGDPCYVFNRKHWEELGDQTDWFEKRDFGEIGDQKMVAFGTAHGDGCYRDQLGHEYPVDAGLIGAVPIEMVDHSCERGTLITFGHPFKCWDDGAGRMTFGHIKIDTTGENEDE